MLDLEVVTLSSVVGSEIPDSGFQGNTDCMAILVRQNAECGGGRTDDETCRVGSGPQIHTNNTAAVSYINKEVLIAVSSGDANSSLVPGMLCGANCTPHSSVFQCSQVKWTPFRSNFCFQNTKWQLRPKLGLGLAFSGNADPVTLSALCFYYGDDIAKLAIVDYVILGLMLLVSVAIGIYHGCTGNKQRTTQTYLVADRKMNFIPVGVSIMASTTSAIALLGTVAEIYMYTTMFVWIFVAFLIMIPCSAHLYLPVFYNLGITSIYEYLELRFSKPTRIICTLIYIIYKVLYLGIVIYAPSLALSAVSGLNLFSSTLTVGIVCTFYTAIGGMKAVVWTDVLQSIIVYAGLLAVIIKGTIILGGIQNAWRIAEEGGRVEFLIIDVDPTIRNTVWSLTIGFTLNMMPLTGVSQQAAQRFNSCKSARDGIKAMYLHLFFSELIVIILAFSAIIIYAVYATCSPLAEGKISSPDQLMPYFVVEHFKHVPGIAGLFIAATFSGTLSTLSSGLNSLAAVTFEDLMKMSSRVTKLSDRKATVILKILAAVYGVLAIVFVFLVSQFGTLITLSVGLSGLLLAPVLGVFTLGLFFPCANSKGAFIGLMSGLGVSAMIFVGNLFYKYRPPPLPMSIAGCIEPNATVTNTTLAYITELVETVTIYENLSTLPSTPQTESYGFKDFMKISYLWYGLLETSTVLIVGLLVSFLTGYTRPKDVDPRLLSPLYTKYSGCCPSFCCLPITRHTEDNMHQDEGAIELHRYKDSRYIHVANKDM
ncbi:sodium-coupled monocarboxylate transporter 2-like [Saccoglossus kowalevskii]|uniref:Sodium-coupled monocarboxylate transporter 2-like n=1 Tax=Saccoglossus kowalevskii TaxID=10224 RepID=A0ABM0MKP5_SACKO|nr:PREDICTED: sodium-coupled monocarboxylate transporter 2-like [Saccoglossus kowalevskii]